MSKEGYFWLDVKPSDAKIINKWLVANGAVEVNDLHCTLMYDQNDPDITVELSKDTFIGSIATIHVLGEKDSPWRSLVLGLFSESLEERHLKLREYGFNHSYAIYQPHVSIVNLAKLAESKNETEANIILDRLINNLPDLTCVLPMVSLINESREKSK